MLFFFELFLFVLVMLTLALGELVGRGMALTLWLVVSGFSVVGYVLARRAVRGLVNAEPARAPEAPPRPEPEHSASALPTPDDPIQAGPIPDGSATPAPPVPGQRPADPIGHPLSLGRERGAGGEGLLRTGAGGEGRLPPGGTGAPAPPGPADERWARTLLYNWRRTNVLLFVGALAVGGWYWLGR